MKTKLLIISAVLLCLTSCWDETCMTAEGQVASAASATCQNDNEPSGPVKANIVALKTATDAVCACGTTDCATQALKTFAPYYQSLNTSTLKESEKNQINQLSGQLKACSLQLRIDAATLDQILLTKATTQ